MHRHWHAGSLSQLPVVKLFFLLKHFDHFSQRHFGHWVISIICLTAVLKLTTKCFLAWIFKHSDRNDLIFFGHHKNVAVCGRKKNSCEDPNFDNNLNHMTSYALLRVSFFVKDSRPAHKARPIIAEHLTLASYSAAGVKFLCFEAKHKLWFLPFITHIFSIQDQRWR